MTSLVGHMIYIVSHMRCILSIIYVCSGIAVINTVVGVVMCFVGRRDVVESLRAKSILSHLNMEVGMQYLSMIVVVCGINLYR